MSIRSLVTVAVVVWALAVLIAVFLGLPRLLTVEGIDINAGLIISGVAAVGTVGTLAWAVVNGLELRRHADADRREAEAIRNEANIEKRLDQARRVCGWVTSLGQLPQSPCGPRPHSQRLQFSNSSPEPVHELVAYLVWVQGSGPRTGEEMQGHHGATRMRAIVQVLPPGNFRVTLDGPADTPAGGRLGLEVAFTDGAGRHWVRRVPSGNLESLDVTPVAHYGIGRPLPPYDQLEPWPS